MQNINSVEQLRKIDRQLRTFSLVSNMPDYQFTIPELSESINQEKSQLLNNYKNECGCSTGSLFMGVSIISIISYYLISKQGISDIDLKNLLLFTVLVIGSALIGKIVGLLWARFRMIQVVRKTVALTNK